jgi:D-alanyl-D-alanine carboxypeptidase (penicillin-binding protein 5/6)
MGKFVNQLGIAAALAGLMLVCAPIPAQGAAKKKKSSSSASTKPTTATMRARRDPVPPPDNVSLTPGMKLPVPEIPDDLTELPLAARGAIVIDANTGETLYEKNADEPQYPASTTKIMTALLVIEAGDLDHIIEVTDEDSKVGESSLDIKPGDQFTRKEALFGLMLKSANDVAHALGRDNAGSIEAFAEKMTRRAAELGAKNTHFANPHGLHDKQHYTTPRDLAQIARAAMKQPLFRRIVSTEFFTWNPPGIIVPLGPRDLKNHNRLLFAFPGCTGVKTGYTIPAQQVLVSAAQWGTREVIAVVMHTHKPGIWDDSKLLLTWGLERGAR